MITCNANGCKAMATTQWMRDANPTEVATFAEDDTNTSVTSPMAQGVTVPVFACDKHALDLEKACLVHESTCTAPSTECGCHPTNSNQRPANF